MHACIVYNSVDALLCSFIFLYSLLLIRKLISLRLIVFGSIDLKSMQAENMCDVIPPTSRSSNYIALRYSDFPLVITVNSLILMYSSFI